MKSKTYKALREAGTISEDGTVVFTRRSGKRTLVVRVPETGIFRRARVVDVTITVAEEDPDE